MPIISGLEKMNVEEIFKLTNGMDYSPETGRLEAAKAALQVRIADQVCHTVNEGKKDFADVTGELRGSIDFESLMKGLPKP